VLSDIKFFVKALWSKRTRPKIPPVSFSPLEPFGRGMSFFVEPAEDGGAHRGAAGYGLPPLGGASTKKRKTLIFGRVRSKLREMLIKVSEFTKRFVLAEMFQTFFDVQSLIPVQLPVLSCFRVVLFFGR